MASVHLFSPVGCCVGQGLFLSMLQLKAPVRHVAEAQTAVFLGVAGAVVVLSTSCLNSNGSGAECAVYYGSAAVPRVAAAGALVWSIVLYVSSLGCQPWSSGHGISLGLRGKSGMTASATMALVPWLIMKTLVQTCGDRWRVHLCSEVGIKTNAAVTLSTVTAKCNHLDASINVTASVAVLSLLLGWIGGVLASATEGVGGSPNLKGDHRRGLGHTITLVATLVATAGPFVVSVCFTCLFCWQECFLYL